MVRRDVLTRVRRMNRTATSLDDQFIQNLCCLGSAARTNSDETTFWNDQLRVLMRRARRQ